MNERQQQILEEIGIPLWLQREAVVTYDTELTQSVTHEDITATQAEIRIQLSGSAVSGYMWLSESKDISASEKALLAKIQAAAAGADGGLLANHHVESSITLAASIKDQLITRLIVFGSAEFIAQVKTSVGDLSVDLIAAPPLPQLAGSKELKRKLWEQLKAISAQ